MSDTVPIMVGGVIANLTDAQLQAAYAGQTITPTATFNFEFGGESVEYQQDISQVVSTGLLAALIAAAAPFTQP